MGNQLALTNVIDISVSQANLGVGNYNTSNLAIFTDETPGMSFGDLGYAAYVTASPVATDFGSTSKTYVMALAVFSQQPNILAGGGQLIVILLEHSNLAVTAVQHVNFSTVPTVGNYQLGYNGNYTGDIAFGDNATAVQVALRLVSGLSSVTVTGSTSAGFVVTFTGVTGPALLLTVRHNSLQDTSGYDVVVTPVTTVVGVPAGGAETLANAITRTASLVQYFGIIVDQTCADYGQSQLLAAAAVIQALNKIGFFVTFTEADIESGGMIDMLATGGFTQSRGLYYGDDTGHVAIIMLASYASRAISTNFSGSNTTQTMHLKTLTGVQPDPSMTQTILNLALAAGADTYVSLQGDPAVFTSNANGGFFDQIYNLQWFVGALQVAGYNFLAQTGTKVPQTESGMDGLKGAYRNICNQAVINGYSAPGSWNSSTTFGNPAQLIANVAQIGYYLYSLPISQQAQADRVDRDAPLVQIALKEAGAIQESSVVVNINP